MKNKKGFSFVEIIIVIAILALIGVIATKISGDSKDKTENVKIKSDLSTISNALLNYYQKEKDLPLPEGNNNYYKNNGGYSHEKFNDEGTEAFGVHGFTPNEALKKFLTNVPRDPRTNQNYAYGRTKEELTFEVVGIEKKGEEYISRVSGNYINNQGPIGLVRQYNGPYFITDGSNNLPYNPEKILLVATDLKGNIFKEKDILVNKGGKISRNGENLEVEYSEDGKFYDLYISDGSIARLDLSEDVNLTFGKDNYLFAYIEGTNKSKVSMFLEAGTAWIFAPDLNKSGYQEIETKDIVAAVRGTIYKVNANKSEATIYKGEIEVKKSNNKIEPIKGNIEEIPYPNFFEKNISKAKNEEINTTNFFEIFSFKDGIVSNNEEILDKEKIKNYIGKIDENYYTLKIEEGKIKTEKIGKIVDENENKVIKYENSEEKIYDSKIVYDKNCLEVSQKEENKFFNKCDENIASIFEGFSEVINTQTREANEPQIKNKKFGYDIESGEIILKNLNNYIIEFEIEKEGLLTFLKNKNIFLFKNLALEIKKENCSKFLCDLLELKEGKLKLYLDKDTNIEIPDLEIEKEQGNYKIVYKVETKNQKLESKRIFGFYIIKDNKILFRGYDIYFTKKLSSSIKEANNILLYPLNLNNDFKKYINNFKIYEQKIDN